MFLVLTQQDLALLSPELRAELQRLVFGSTDTGSDERTFAAIETSDIPYQESERDFGPPWPEAPFAEEGDSDASAHLIPNNRTNIARKCSTLPRRTKPTSWSGSRGEA